MTSLIRFCESRIHDDRDCSLSCCLKLFDSALSVFVPFTRSIVLEVFLLFLVFIHFFSAQQMNKKLSCAAALFFSLLFFSSSLQIYIFVKLVKHLMSNILFVAPLQPAHTQLLFELECFQNLSFIWFFQQPWWPLTCFRLTEEESSCCSNVSVHSRCLDKLSSNINDWIMAEFHFAWIRVTPVKLSWITATASEQWATLVLFQLLCNPCY